MGCLSLMKFIVFTSLSILMSISYSAPIKVEHNHDNRQHSHLLPKEGLNHNHNNGSGGSSTTSVTYGENSPVFTNINGDIIVNYGLMINGKIKKSKYSKEYSGYIYGAFKVYKVDMELANDFIAKASKVDNSKALTMYMAAITSSYWGKKLIKPDLVLRSFIQITVAIGLLEDSKEDDDILSLAYISRGTFNELMNDYSSALNDYKKSCLANTENCNVYSNSKNKFLRLGLI